ncbi:hypothetical protein FI667_g2100, partial [Globisporangium splendens]
MDQVQDHADREEVQQQASNSINGDQELSSNNGVAEPQSSVVACADKLVKLKSDDYQSDSQDWMQANAAERSEEQTEDKYEGIDPHCRVEIEQQQQQPQDDDGAVDESMPKWIRKNFPGALAEENFRSQFAQEVVSLENDGWSDPDAAHARRCEECCTRRQVFCCVDCNQRLCYTCADAIHIIPSLACHVIVSYDDCRDQPDLSNALQPELSLSPSSDDKVGVYELAEFYYRLVWLRGVEVLPNGFYRASLELTPVTSGLISSTLTQSHWPMEIGLFPTQLGAFRAVITAEEIARMKFRHELVSGRFDAEDFPSVAILNEILEETDAVLGAEFKIHLSKQDDSNFLQDLGKGKWDYRAWMRSIQREDHLKEEDAVALLTETAQSLSSHSSAMAPVTMPWQPAGRIHYFLMEQRELFFPEQVRRKHLESIMTQMLFVYIGFAWTKWRRFVKRSRRHEHHQKLHCGAVRLQTWVRRLRDKWEKEADGANQDASLQVLLLYQRRQVEAAKLYHFMDQQYREKQRNALQRWASITRLKDPDVRRRFEIYDQTKWHPSYDITTLPKLPRVYAHKRNDGSFAIDDMKMYKQFRSNHAGPTDVSYWVIRDRILAGVYPIGKSFREARRIVARADYTTSVLLQEISVFVCLVGASELEAFERKHVASVLEAEGKKKGVPGAGMSRKQNAVAMANRTSSGKQPQSNAFANQASATQTALQTPWMFERVVRAKYDALQVEPQAAVKMNLRQVQLAQSEYDENAAVVDDDPELKETLANKAILAKQNAEKAKKMLDALTVQLQFVHFPIQKDGVPETEKLNAFLVQLEDFLRAKRNIYVFSRNGHGRTGFTTALLLGRLYGISSLEALERAQRLHDCQWSMHSVPSTRSTSSPKAAVQITAVQRLLAHWDAIYVPITNENSSEDYHVWRAQQCGVVVDPFIKKEGFMISEKPDSAMENQQSHEYQTLQRIAKRESGAAQLMRRRQREAHERAQMSHEEFHSAQLKRTESRRESLVTMHLAMIGAATADVVDDLVKAIEANAALK